MLFDYILSLKRDTRRKRKRLLFTISEVHTLQVAVIRVNDLVGTRRTLEVRPNTHPLLRYCVGVVLEGC